MSTQKEGGGPEVAWRPPAAHENATQDVWENSGINTHPRAWTPQLMVV